MEQHTKVTLIGIGGGSGNTLTREAYEALAEASLVIGSGRVLKNLPPSKAKVIDTWHYEGVPEIIKENNSGKVCAVFSGDTGFYSGAVSLASRLTDAGYEVNIIPGVSSLQYLSAALGRPWQEWKLVSAHGKKCDPVFEVMQKKPVLFLTSGPESVKEICNALIQAGLEDLQLTLGENLSYEDQRVVSLPAKEMVNITAAKLNVLLCEPAPVYEQYTPGMEDELFIRGDVPMTKQEVRSVILSKLRVRPDDICWDIGAGTGSVSIELARVSRRVTAFEKKEEAVELIRQNRRKFHAYNLEIKEGTAPSVFTEMFENGSGTAPDAVFIGGSSGNMQEIISEILRINKKARICVSAIAIESVSAAVSSFEKEGIEPDIIQIGISRARKAGSLHLMTALNPVYVITGENT